MSEASNLESAILATVRITSHYEVRDIFNPKELDSQGKSIGSGFFIGNKGYILTCYHVVADSVKLFVNLIDAGKKNYKAKIVSIYPEIDLAVIKIFGHTNELSIGLGDSDTYRLGSDTIAIGYPLGDDTVKTTKGIISGVKDHLLQTDTTINSGNSGGPLLDSNYRVIGINSSKVIGSNTEGTSYCIPVAIFKTVQHLMMKPLESPINHNVQTEDGSDILILYKPNFYCEFQVLESDTSRLLCYDYMNKNNQHIDGYMIKSIYKKSPLAMCNDPMRTYDILIEYDGKKVDSYGEINTETSMAKMNLTDYILTSALNQKINIKYFSVAKQTIIETSIVFKNEYLYMIPERFYPNKINYIDIDDVIICELTVDHVIDIISNQYDTTHANLANMFNFILKENREIPRIFISRVLASSPNIDNNNINNGEGSIIVKVNNINVYTIDQFKQIIYKEKYFVMDNKKYIHLTMMNNENITMTINTVESDI
jgi:S1-C subfamily serine protease